MENLLPYNAKEINFIKLFFKILVVFTVIGLVLFFTLPINDSVSFSNGEIISENPEIEYKSPFEAVLEKVYVKEGDKVKKGDTLAIINNGVIDKDINSTESEMKSLSGQLLSNKRNLVNLDNKIVFQRNEINLNYRQYIISKGKTEKEIQSETSSVNLFKNRLEVKSKKLKIDSLIYKKGVISLLELRNSYDDFLTYKKNVIDAQNNLSQLNARLFELENNYLQKKNSISISITELEEQKENLKQSISKMEASLKKEGNSFDFLTNEIGKRYLLSEIDGVVTKVFNEKQEINYVDKGFQMFKISPNKKGFYAKAQIDERDIRHLKLGQNVNLKLDSYNYYKYGAIKGKISYIPIRKNLNEPFYVSVELSNKDKDNLKSGYTVRGDVILETIPLYKYAVKKMFRKMD
ncbi:HlyD family secretion protein [Polaribacter uvawellassae]|uniref:HlyD family secretion protein n=1 Tax=Polaribacter uvawellassae TaxID=3133495 RepID=UPI00321C003C